MEKIEIDQNTKATIVFAKCDDSPENWYDWLLLVAYTEFGDEEGTYKIFRHISYETYTKKFYAGTPGTNIGLQPGNWGSTAGYTFYKPTEEQKKLIMDGLKERRLKFVRTLNKLVDR